MVVNVDNDYHYQMNIYLTGDIVNEFFVKFCSIINILLITIYN